MPPTAVTFTKARLCHLLAGEACCGVAVWLIVALFTQKRRRLHARPWAMTVPDSALGEEEQRDAGDEEGQVSLGVKRNKPRESLIRNKAGSWTEKQTKKRKKKKKTPQPLIISRRPLDKRGGKCHSIQQPPRAAACLDTAFHEFLLITAWELFGGGVCLSLLGINSSPTDWHCPATGNPGQRTEAGEPGQAQ